MMANRSPVIAVRYPVWSRYWQTVLPGVVDYIGMHTRWRLQTEDNSYGEMETVRIDADWQGDGAILFRATEQELAAYKARGQAVVLTSTEGPDLGYPRVVPDNRAIGRLAAKHLAGKGLHHFAFLARGETLYQEGQFAPGFRVYPRERLGGFREQLASQGIEPLVRMLEGRELWHAEAWKLLQADVSGFLAGLPKPCGLFVVDDALGAVVMRAAGELGVAVPGDLAVLGFGNDPLYCMAAVPALSSIVYPGREIGRLAADLIARQLAGQDCAGIIERVTVGEVVQRESTNTIATGDPLMARALAWIQDHAPVSPVTVAELEAATGMSSSALAQKFRLGIGRSPKQEIMRVRLDRLRSLLGTTNAPVAQIAKVMKFASAHELSRFFLHETGERPTSYRDRIAEQREAPGVGAVIFDMDGTLFDTERMYCQAYMAGMARCGGHLEHDQYFREFTGRDNKSIEETLSQQLPEARRAGLPAAWRAEFIARVAKDGVMLKPGVVETLSALHDAGVRMALASSSDREHVDMLLQSTGLAGYFEVTVAGDEVAAGKPAPDLFLRAARLLAVLPSRCVVVEDSHAGVRAAHAAGMDVVMVPDQVPPDRVVRGLAGEVAVTMHGSARLQAIHGKVLKG